MSREKPTWMCPVCDKPAPYDQLISSTGESQGHGDPLPPWAFGRGRALWPLRPSWSSRCLASHVSSDGPGLGREANVSPGGSVRVFAVCLAIVWLWVQKRAPDLQGLLLLP